MSKKSDNFANAITPPLWKNKTSLYKLETSVAVPQVGDVWRTDEHGEFEIRNIHYDSCVYQFSVRHIPESFRFSAITVSRDDVKNGNIPMQLVTKAVDKKVQVPQVGDIWKFDKGAQLEVCKIFDVMRVDEGFYVDVGKEDGHHAIHTVLIGDSAINDSWFFIHRPEVKAVVPSNPNIVNPIHYPDAPETKEECERAFDILRNLCKSHF